MQPRLLLSDARGRVIEHPWLLATLRSGEALLPAQGTPIALPRHGKLVQLPGRRPVGVDPETFEFVLVKDFELGGRRFVPNAVGALLPPGYTRTFLPGEVQDAGPQLPQWAYTAAAWTEAGPVAWARHTDRRGHWSPDGFSTPDLKRRVRELEVRFPGNRVLAQLHTCALVYRCFTSQNLFYQRDEAALPASVMCNAQCVGCISDQPDDGAPASHARMEEGPAALELAQVGAHHLAHATGRVMVSFGQGCEGEPLTRWKPIAQSIAAMRARTARGSINLNTNGSLTRGLAALFDAGLDAVRVSLNSAHPPLYAAYYRPEGYGFADVEASLSVAREQRGYVALNLLCFPGVTDQRREVDALCALVRRHRVDQVQTRSLCIDPAQYLALARDTAAGGEALGIDGLLRALKKAAPWLVIGNFARAKHERARRKK